MNYITALPDFIEMQRISFCWFISEGLKAELTNFSSIFDFSGNIEYIFFGQEYKLVKPIYNASNAKRHASNYIAQLIMPIEMRNRQTNTIMKRGRLSIANLPLMTTSATFIVNGCERIIVSQVIRSPGIYFEKNKKQRRRKLNKLTLSNDFHKVRSFTQTSFGILKHSKVLSSLSISKNFKFLQNLGTGNLSNDFLSFIEFFKVYGIISKNLQNNLKSQQIQNFLKLLKIINNDDIIIDQGKKQKCLVLLNDLNNLLKLMIKFQILQTFLTEKKKNK
jgi:DNA-directed RNA polymerase beta subunit